MNVVELGELLVASGGRLVGPYVEHEDEGGYAGLRRVEPSGPIVRRTYLAVLADREVLVPLGLGKDDHGARNAIRELSERPIAYVDVDEAGSVVRWAPVSPIATVAALLRDKLGPGEVLEG